MKLAAPNKKFNSVFSGLPPQVLSKTPTYSEQATVTNAPIQKEVSIITPYSRLIDKRDVTESDKSYFSIIEASSGIISVTHVPLPEIVDQIEWTFTPTKSIKLKYANIWLISDVYGGAIVEWFRIILELRFDKTGAGQYMMSIPIQNVYPEKGGQVTVALNDMILPYGGNVVLHRRSIVRAGGASTATWSFKANLFYEEI
jgi:hypothetical protein